MQQLGKFKVDIQRLYNKDAREVTIVQVFNKNNKLLTRGRVTRNHQDTHHKSQGVKRALKEALTGSVIPKDQRKGIWEAFRTQTKNPRWSTPVK